MSWIILNNSFNLILLLVKKINSFIDQFKYLNNHKKIFYITFC